MSEEKLFRVKKEQLLIGTPDSIVKRTEKKRYEYPTGDYVIEGDALVVITQRHDIVFPEKPLVCKREEEGIVCREEQ